MEITVRNKLSEKAHFCSSIVTLRLHYSIQSLLNYFFFKRNKNYPVLINEPRLFCLK